MSSTQKTLRYYYWIALEFIKKHLRIILLSSFITVAVSVSLVTFSPYFLSIASTQKNIIGMVGEYDLNNLPDTILIKISSGLIYINDKGEIIPVLANSWEKSKDELTYRFNLKKDIYWNDGKTFTTKDISYKFKDIAIKPIDDHVIEFVLQKPLPIFPTYLSQPIIKYPLTGVAGLYKVERIKDKYGNLTEIDLSPNKDGIPYLVYRFYDNETNMINAYKLGEITEMNLTKKNLADLFLSWKNTTVTKSVDYTRLLTLFFNLNNPLLKEKDVRKAIAMSIPKESFVDFGEEATSSIPPVSWAFSPSVKRIPHDNDLAKKLISKYAASDSAVLRIDTYYDYLDTAEKIKESLESNGIEITLNTLSYGAQPDFDMLLAYWKVPLDPDQYYYWHSTQKQGNITHYNNPKIDKLLEDGRNSLSLDERKKIYYDFQKTIMDDLPSAFIFYPYTYTIKRQ